MDYTRTDFRVKQREFAIERAKITEGAQIEKMECDRSLRSNIDALKLAHQSKINAINLKIQQKLKEVDEKEAALMCKYRNMFAIESLQNGEKNDAGDDCKLQ